MEFNQNGLDYSALNTAANDAATVKRIQEAFTYEDITGCLAYRHSRVYKGTPCSSETAKKMERFSGPLLVRAMKSYPNAKTDVQVSSFNLVKTLIDMGYDVDLDGKIPTITVDSKEILGGPAIIAVNNDVTLSIPVEKGWPVCRGLQLEGVKVAQNTVPFNEVLALIVQFTEVKNGKAQSIAALDGFRRIVGLANFVDIEGFAVGCEEVVNWYISQLFEGRKIDTNYNKKGSELANDMIKGMRFNIDRGGFRDGVHPIIDVLKVANINVKSLKPFIEVVNENGAQELTINRAKLKVVNTISDRRYEVGKGASIDQAAYALAELRTARLVNNKEISAVARCYYLNMMVPSELADLCYLATDLAMFILPPIVCLRVNKNGTNTLLNFLRSLKIIGYKGTVVSMMPEAIASICGKKQTDGTYVYMGLRVMSVLDACFTNINLWNQSVGANVKEAVLFDYSGGAVPYIRDRPLDYHREVASHFDSNLIFTQNAVCPVIFRTSCFNDMHLKEGVTFLRTCQPHNLVVYATPSSFVSERAEKFVLTYENCELYYGLSIFMNICRSLRFLCGISPTVAYKFYGYPEVEIIRKGLGKIIKAGLTFTDVEIETIVMNETLVQREGIQEGGARREEEIVNNVSAQDRATGGVSEVNLGGLKLDL